MPKSQVKGKVVRCHAARAGRGVQFHLMVEGDPEVYRANAVVHDPEAASHVLMTQPGDIVEFSVYGSWGDTYTDDFKNHNVQAAIDMAADVL